MISEELRSLVRCPDCRGRLQTSSSELMCPKCGRHYPTADHSFVDLRPNSRFDETTKYLDEKLHEDERYETVSLPLLSTAIRNDMLNKFLDFEAGDRVLDLGCGSGRFLVWNTLPGIHLVGIDVSPHFALEARNNVDLLLGDLRRLPIEDGAFSKAYSFDVLEHLSRDDLVSMLDEANRVLEPGGRLFVYSHVRQNSILAIGLRAINRLASGLEAIGLLDLAHERLRKSDHRNPLADIDDLHSLVAVAGFSVRRIRYYTPLIGGFIENILLRVAEHALSNRIKARKIIGAGETGKGHASPSNPMQIARADAKRWIAKRGVVYLVLRCMTWLMKIDLWLFGRIKSGPFFTLLEKTSTSSST